MSESAPGPGIETRCCAEASLRHCHETYVVHPGHDDGECTDTGCDVPAEGHSLVVPCAELAPACRCTSA